MILIAGGTGFIGSAIARQLVARGHTVAVLSRRGGSSTISLGGKPVEVRRGDVTEPAGLAAALTGVETVVGAVQFQDFPNQNRGKGLTFDNIDRRGTEHLVAAAKAAGASRYVYISGVGAAPDAPRVWFRAKWGAETAVRESGLQALIVRPSWVFGPGDHALNKYVAFVRSPLPVVPVIGNGKQRLQPVFVEDVARLVADSVDGRGAAEGTFEIGGPQVLSMDAIIREVERALGKKKPLVHQPVWLTKALMSPKAAIHALPLPLTPEGVTFATIDATADTEPLLAAFPELRLTPLPEALATYLSPVRRRSAPSA
ncbi:MAG TPA: NAD-dependent epimerase/dehydratase family protein [Dehalococcoidia bacterium]|nr:NAD-dependent epimerase/dehydratase family protein [Dehalococcoidia bacterium]